MLTAVTYNIKAADHGTSLHSIGEELRRSGADVVGLQEVDRGTERSFGQDQAVRLAELAGLKYAHFFPSLPLQGGKYGIATLSRYPIVEAHCHRMESGGGEPRLLSLCVLETPAGPLFFYNTHLSLLPKARKEEFLFLAAQIRERRAVLTGDFNIATFDEYQPLKRLGRINTPEKPLVSFKAGGAIDNIFYTGDLKLRRSGMRRSYSSDHEMLFAELAP